MEEKQNKKRADILATLSARARQLRAEKVKSLREKRTERTEGKRQTTMNPSLGDFIDSFLNDINQRICGGKYSPVQSQQLPREAIDHLRNCALNIIEKEIQGSSFNMTRDYNETVMASILLSLILSGYEEHCFADIESLQGAVKRFCPSCEWKRLKKLIVDITVRGNTCPTLLHPEL